MDADEYELFGAVHDLVSRMSARLGLERQAGRGYFYAHGDDANLTDQLEVIARLRVALAQAEDFTLIGLRPGVPDAPRADLSVIARAMGIDDDATEARVREAQDAVADLRPPEDGEGNPPPARTMGEFVASLPGPVL